MMVSKGKTPLALGMLLALAMFGCSHGGGSMGMQKDSMDSSMSSSGAATKPEGMHDAMQSSMDGMKHGDMKHEEMKHEEMKGDAPMSGDNMDDGKMEKPMDAMKKDDM